MHPQTKVVVDRVLGAVADTRMALQFVVGSAMTVASLTEASSDKAQAAIIRSVLPEVHPTDRDDQMLVSDAYWIAFASDVMHAKSDEFATKSCQVWDKMQEGHIVTLAHRIVAAVVWRATNLDSIDKELVSVKRHLEGIGVADCLYQSFRTECYRMVSMKLCASDGAGADDNQLGYLDNLISRSIVDPEDLSSLRKELRRGITMLVSESDPRSSFLAVQVWRQWISKTHHSQRDLMEVKKIARYLEEKCCESQDPLALIGMFECRITLACLSVDDEEFTSTLSNFRELPDVFFRLTHLPPKAVYEAAFLAYWARASGACQDAAFKLKVTALLKSFKATCAPCNNLHAYPFISLRYGLNYHFYRLSVDLQSAIGASSLQDTTDVNNLMHWLSDHTAVSSMACKNSVLGRANG